MTLPPGYYFLELYNSSFAHPGTFLWETSGFTNTPQSFVAAEAPGRTWFTQGFDLAIEVRSGVTGADCNDTGVLDECEVMAGGDFDVNGSVDLADFAYLQECLTGPGKLPLPAGSRVRVLLHSGVRSRW